MTEMIATKKTALIVSGGHTDAAQLRQQIGRLRQTGGLLIAADSGLEVLDRLMGQEDLAGTAPRCDETCDRDRKEGGISYLPDVAVGDFDSVDPQVLERFQKRGQIRFERHRPEKNETDTELAFSIAQEAGVTDMILMGATGTRLDHVLSNVHLLKAAMDRGLRCQLLDPHNRIRLVSGRTVFVRTEESYPFVSFVPLTMEVTGITLTGFKYPLQEHCLVLGQECGLCVSNELAADEAVLEFDSGLLLVIEARD